MFISKTPAWLHKASAFAVTVFASAAAWNWTSIVDAHTAAMIVSGLGFAKLTFEFITPDAPAE